MNDDELDRLLSQPDDIVASSGLTETVMRRIEREAGEPRPIPFPWRRAWPGIFLCLAFLRWLIAASDSSAHNATVPALFWAASSALVAVASLTLVFLYARRP